MRDRARRRRHSVQHDAARRHRQPAGRAVSRRPERRTAARDDTHACRRPDIARERCGQEHSGQAERRFCAGHQGFHVGRVRTRDDQRGREGQLQSKSSIGECMSTSSLALVVPVNVLALAVNEKDAHDATPYFSGSNTVFTNQLGPSQAFLGANVNRSLMGPPAQPLQAGVHLHWALPDALSKAVTDADGNLSFKAAPNRWLISRFVIEGGRAARTSWVVLSDLLNDRMPAGQTSITLPAYTTPSGQDYQYSGEFQTFDQQWKEPAIPAERSFASLTGMELTAVANGQPVFASFYPNCRGVFGFVDALTDLKLPPNGSANLMYTVTGWYGDNRLDPLFGGLDVTQLQAQLAWTFDDPTGQAKPDFSLYQGAIQGVTWHPDEAYLPDYSAGIPTIDLDLSLGNNPPEAMSCFLQNTLRPTLPYFQVLLNAYFEGLLGKLKNPQPSQLATLEEELQENGFQSIKAEYVYTIVKKVVTYDPLNQPVVTYVQVDDLPLRVGDALNLLNFHAQSVQLLAESLANFNWQMFADWYRIFMAVASQQQTCYNIAYRKYGGLAAQTQQLDAATKTLDDQIAAVEAQLPPDCMLQKSPAPRFWQANDLVFMLGGKDLPPSNRYDDNGQYAPTGNLRCRLQDRSITSATANQVTVDAGDFSASALPTPNGLPAADTFNRLLFEALILNADLLTSLTGTPIGFDDVRAALLGQSGRLTVTGTAPALLSVSRWQGNPWMPLFGYWQVEFQPVFATTDSTKTQLYNYPSDFFTGQFTIEQNNGAAIEFTPATDPARGPFTQRYEGASILSTSVIDGFVKQLSQSADPVLQQCLQTIRQQNMVMQAFSGLNAAFLMQDQALQLNIGVPEDTEYYPLTQAIAAALGGYANIGPGFNGFYNPVRAGFLKVGLTLIDVFGQKKTVNPVTINIAQSLTIDYGGQPVPGVAYLPPRLAQASRLLFRFLAADGTELAEMNIHPATTPICGWFMPSHLNGSLFIYDAQGASLGSLFLNDAKTRILWQSAPGNDATVNQGVREVMQDQQPQLRDLVIALSESKPEYFNDFMLAIDNVNGFVEPQQTSTNSDMAVLVGRPMAVVQAALALELKGTPQYNQSWAVLNLVDTDPFAETDNDFTKVEFPVVLGNLTDLNDGLIGYFRFGQDNYDWADFYTMGAQPGPANGVQQPTQNTITLNPRPGVGGNTLDGAFRKLLMLIDPRAVIHATTGILPTKGIRIPSDMYADTLSTLEMTFLTTPILGGSSALTLPLPSEAGYQWSWVQERRVGGKTLWETRGDIGSTPPGGPWTYTPQTVLEGWLRLNPDLLLFELFNADRKAILAQGLNDNLTLNVINRQGRPVSFASGALVPEGTPSDGSIFYIHFGNAVPQDQVANVVLQADGWAFKCFTDDLYGSYWAAGPAEGLALGGGARFSIHVNNLEVKTDKQQITIFFDYYNVTHINDGVYQDALSIKQAITQ
ncbi:hypothetical protein [Burkholderia ubonensis]|uniref:hypothetical protein n=1 Tax=Burkholderia ubonensis TaxID=101571 RepID=UPI00114CA093|nr:hypothetical protein [Burkholderia ubonensis]